MRDRYFRFAVMLAIFITMATCLSVVCHGSSYLPVEILDDDRAWMHISLAVSMPILATFILLRPKEFAGISAMLTPWVFIIYGGILCVWGMMQIYGYSYSNHSLYSLTGPFYNSGPYSGYIAMILPICVHEWFNQRNANKWLSYISLSVMLLIVCLLPAGMSRSAWMASAISCIYVISMNYWSKIGTLINRYRKRIVPFAIISLVIISLVIITLSVIGLYMLKKDSADGRLFMWKISSQAVAQNPWTGSGWDNVPAAYGQAQEKFFAEGNYSETEEYVAGTPEYVFNEYLQASIAWGLPVTCMCLLVVIFCFYIGNRNGLYGICGAILSLSVFAFSSYPFQFPAFVSALFVLLFTCIVQTIKSKKSIILYPVVCGLLLCTFVCSQNYRQDSRIVEACKKWNGSRIFYQSGAYSRAELEYAEIEAEMKGNARFMFEYGHTLHKLHKYKKSNEILIKALSLSGDPMILNIIGKNEQELKEYDRAEHYFLRSVHRLPSRIYPYYLLAKLYSTHEYYNYDKFKWACNMVIHKEPKVQSTAIRQMRDEIRKLSRTTNIK